MIEPAEAEGSVTAILKRADPLWWWLRENFKLPSLISLALAIAGAGSWIYVQRSDLAGLDRQIKNLATSDQVSAVGESLKALSVQLDDQGDRLDRLERNWDDAGRVAAEFKPRRRALPRPRPVNQVRSQVPP